MRRVLLFTLLMVPAVARANGATYGGVGSDVYPIENHDVSMKREHIVLTVQGDDAGWGTSTVSFDCRFEFVNHGPARTIRMGFPLVSDGWEQVLPDTAVLGFRARVDGTLVDTTPAKKGNVLLWPVHFAEGETRLVRVTYTLPWSSADLSLYPLSISYVLKTGALWRDPIESSVIELDAGRSTPFPSLSFDPQPNIVQDGMARWEYENVRPAQDIRIRFSPELAKKFAGQFLGAFRPSEHDLAGRTFLELVDGEWEEGLAYEGAEGDTAMDMKGRDAVAASAHGWRWVLERISNSRQLDPLEQLNLEYVRALETTCRASRSRNELAARLAAIHQRFW